MNRGRIYVFLLETHYFVQALVTNFSLFLLIINRLLRISQNKEVNREVGENLVNKGIAERLKKARLQQNLSIKQFAEKVQVPVATYKEWENGRSIRDGNVYLRLAKVCKMSLHELISGEKTEEHQLVNELNRVINSIEKFHSMLVTYISR